MFKRPAGTSRGILLDKQVWYVIIEREGNVGIGECNPLKGLSLDDIPNFEERLIDFTKSFEVNQEIDFDLLHAYPAIKFGFEMALKDLMHNQKCMLYPSDFTKEVHSIPINGLVWMGDKQFMQSQINEKLKEGFDCIKLKIGSIDFQEELEILKFIRDRFSSDQIELRVDANGAFEPNEALGKLIALSKFQIHSIEQPIKQGQWVEMADLCEKSPIPIALDEELIVIRDQVERKEMLQTIMPDYIILKPSLLGGFEDTNQWIETAELLGIKWWITSALESDIGLNAIAQYTFTKNNCLPQGLGTGTLYTNNIPSPLYIEKGRLHYSDSKEWDLNEILS